jgi:hypothetical protein
LILRKFLKGKTPEYGLQEIVQGWSQWLMPVILAIPEAEIRRTVVHGQPGQKVHKTLSEPMAGCSGRHPLFQPCG